MHESVPLSAPYPGLQRWLAIDTSTERLSVAVGAAGAAEPLAAHDGPGGAQASAVLLPTIDALLRRVGWRLAELDGIVFGQGPGSFTGLRTACAVVQGLAVAARPGGLPVLPLGTLLAVAEDARHRTAPRADGLDVVAALDARMDEIYTASYRWRAGQGWQVRSPARLVSPAQLPVHAASAPMHSDDGAALPTLLAGNVMPVYGERLPTAWREPQAVLAWPNAAALLRLAAAGIQAGHCTNAAGAQPLYVRDKVALTVDEQAALRAQRTANP